MQWISPLLVATLLVSLGALTACGSVAPSEELLELEQRLQDPEAQKLRDIPNAARFFDEARQYRRVSQEAREDRNESRSREYAILGNLRYRTALAIYEQFERIEELNAINAEIERINPEVREVTQARNELARELRELEQDIQQAVRERQQRRHAALESDDNGFEAAGGEDDAASAELLEEANEKIAEAQQLRDQALEHGADQYDRTRGLFERAETQLETGRDLLDDGPSGARTASRQLGFAIQLFSEAHELAVPIHEQMQPENRIASIREDAAANYSSRFTEDETNGVRIILARLFVAGEEDYRRETGPMLDALATIVREYSEFSVRIEGYTQSGGGSTANLTLSQNRAHNVQRDLVEAGVDESRIETEGIGQSNIRFPDRPDNNDRVEVILLHDGR